MGKRVISAVLTLKDQNFSSGLKKAAKDTDDFQRSVKAARNQINRFADSAFTSINRVAKSAAGLSAAGFTAFSAAVASTVTEMDSAFGNLEARTGATGQELEELKAVATSVFEEGFGESIGYVTNEVATLNSMFDDLDSSSLEKIAKGAFAISDIWNVETSEVGKAIKGLMDNFDELSETDALDLITTAFQKTGDYSNDLLDTFNEYAVHFSELGLSAQEFTGILVSGAENGAFNIDKVGDAVKEFGIRAIDGSEATQEGFAAIGLSATEMAQKIGEGGESANNAFMATLAGLAALDDPVKRNQAGVQLFGTMWEDLKDDVVLSMADGKSEIEGFQGATERAANAAQNNFGTKMKKIWREVKIGATEAFAEAGGQDVLDTLATKAEELVPKIEGMVTSAVEFAQSIQENWGTTKKVITPLATSIGALYVSLGAVHAWNVVKGAINAYKTSTFAATVVQQGLNTALKANPIGMVITAITLLVGIGTYLYQNWDMLKEKGLSLWEGLKEAWNGIEEGFSGMWVNMKNSAKAGVNFVIDGINKLIKGFNSVMTIQAPEWVPVIGGKQLGFEIPTIPQFALGTSYFTGGLARINERGGEIVDLPSGSRIYPHDKSIQMAKNESTNNITININAVDKSVNEIVSELIPQLKLRLANI